MRWKKRKAFREQLSHPKIKEVRRIGLMFAVDFESAEIVNRIVWEAKNLALFVIGFFQIRTAFALLRR